MFARVPSAASVFLVASVLVLAPAHAGQDVERDRLRQEVDGLRRRGDLAGAAAAAEKLLAVERAQSGDGSLEVVEALRRLAALRAPSTATPSRSTARRSRCTGDPAGPPTDATRAR